MQNLLENDNFLNNLYSKFKNLKFKDFKDKLSKFLTSHPELKDDNDLESNFRKYIESNFDSQLQKNKDSIKTPDINIIKGLETSLNEINPNDVNVENLEIHDKLNDKIWLNNSTINPKVRKAILMIVKEYIRFLNLPNLKIKDIVFTGSLANKNYTNASDIDVHIITNYNDIDTNNELLLDYFKNKKNVWTDKYDLTIYGYPVELFIQDDGQVKDWTAMYSLVDNKWIQQPELESKTSIDKKTIKDKAIDLINKIEGIENSFKNGKDHKEILDNIEKIYDKIIKLRAVGLPNGGEMSNENLIFKILRTGGFFEKLESIKKDIYKQDLTLKEKLIR